MLAVSEVTVHLKTPHKVQADFVDCEAARIAVKGGRRGGKTVGLATRAVKRFLKKRSQLYGAPTGVQTDAFWFEVCHALAEPIRLGIFEKNETEHTIKWPGTQIQIKAVTCWNPDVLRGGFTDDLYLDEFQLMNEDTWEIVCQPMLLDHNGQAVFVFTPPSLESGSISKARDPRYASKMFNKAKEDTTGTWRTFHFTSHENPYISKEALSMLSSEMGRAAYRREILAEDDDLSVSDLVYGAFDERTQLIPPIPLPKEWPVYVFHDFGQANPAVLLVRRDWKTNLFYTYDEWLPGPGQSIFTITEELKRRTEGLTVMLRVGGNQTTEDETRQGYTAHGWPIVAPRIKQPKAQFARVLAMMERNQIFVFNTCTHYIDELRNALWDKYPDGVKKDTVKDEARWHLSSCARYGFSEFDPETVEAQTAQVQDIRPSRQSRRDPSLHRGY